jgi:hypothetical protein
VGGWRECKTGFGMGGGKWNGGVERWGGWGVERGMEHWGDMTSGTQDGMGDLYGWRNEVWDGGMTRGWSEMGSGMGSGTVGWHGERHEEPISGVKWGVKRG